MRPFAFVAASLVALYAGAAVAAPRCTPLREGEVACLDGKLCECRHDPGGTLTGRRPGTRWDCGAAPFETGQPPAAERSPPPPPFFPPAYPPAPGWR